MNKQKLIILAVIAAALAAAASFAIYHILKPGGIEAEKIEVIPQNEYTENVPMPEYGTPDYVLDNSKHGNYSVFITDITREESEKYIEKLKSDGFEEVEDDAEVTAVGTLLRRGNTTLSVSISKNVLGIYITRDRKKR